MYSKWYHQTWFIALVFAFSFMGLPFIVGLVLLYLQSRENKKVIDAIGNVEKANSLVAEAKAEELKIKEAINDLEKEKVEIIDALNNEKSTLEKEISILETELMVKVVNLDEYSEFTSAECKDHLSILTSKQNELIKSNQAVIVGEPSKSSAKKVQGNNVKQIIRGFNAECKLIISNVTAKNIDSQRSAVQKAFDALNTIYATDGVTLSHELLEMKFKELNLAYTYALKVEQEKEQQRAIREQMVEEEKVRREIEREKARLEKEETQFKNEVNKLLKYLQGTDNEAEKNLYLEKIQELEEKLKLLEKDKENVLQREQNTRAGFVYVISNIGSFGENVYKIGMTRRLEPMDRVKELGDASVPFNFDVHAMIFSEDAPALETTLHQAFRKYELNKVNERKEFFRVPLNEIKDVVLKHHNATVEFTMVAKAEEYRQSLKLEENLESAAS